MSEDQARWIVSCWFVWTVNDPDNSWVVSEFIVDFSERVTYEELWLVKSSDQQGCWVKCHHMKFHSVRAAKKSTARDVTLDTNEEGDASWDLLVRNHNLKLYQLPAHLMEWCWTFTWGNHAKKYWRMVKWSYYEKWTSRISCLFWTYWWKRKMLNLV